MIDTSTQSEYSEFTSRNVISHDIDTRLRMLEVFLRKLTLMCRRRVDYTTQYADSRTGSRLQGSFRNPILQIRTYFCMQQAEFRIAQLSMSYQKQFENCELKVRFSIQQQIQSDIGHAAQQINLQKNNGQRHKCILRLDLKQNIRNYLEVEN